MVPSNPQKPVSFSWIVTLVPLPPELLLELDDELLDELEVVEPPQFPEDGGAT